MISVPYQKLFLFKERISINEKELEILEPFRDAFIKRRHDFAAFMYDFFLNIPETAMYLKHYETPGFLKKAWSYWFESLFKSKLDKEFMGYLWRIGVRHVEINLDQRFSNLGFSVARQFCQQVIASEVPVDKTSDILRIVDKLLDFCILVETDAYIESHARCDMEIVKGIADRIRNKITVIGGNIKRLQREIDASDPASNVYESIITDSSTCERMVVDIRTFVEISQRDPEIKEISLDELINKTLDKLGVRQGMIVEKELDNKALIILADSRDMEGMFYYLLQNSLEAVDSDNPYIKISSYLDPALPHRIKIEIFNTGIPPKKEDIDKLFSPFFSTKTFGTGFGLAISRLATKKTTESCS
jgi:signal transduction histidine kinase